jgi:hypothetical protein
MRLWRISRTSDHDPLKVPRGESRRALELQCVQAFSKFVVTVLSENNVQNLYLSIFEPKILPSVVKDTFAKASYSRGQQLTISDVPGVVHVAIADEIHCKIRDWSCRFVSFTDDYVMYVCLRHEDQIDPDKWQSLDVIIDDASLDLIQTDLYDD